MKFKTDFTKHNAAGFAEARGLYNPENEHDNCGVGFLAKLDNVPTHDLINKAVQLMVNLEHRGAIGGDAATGDGAAESRRLRRWRFLSSFIKRTCKKVQNFN